MIPSLLSTIFHRYKPKKFDKAANKLKKAETAIAKKANEVDHLREQVENLNRVEHAHSKDLAKLEEKKQQQAKKLNDAEEALRAKKMTLSHQKHVVQREIKKKKEEEAAQGVVDEGAVDEGAVDDHPHLHKIVDGTEGHGEEHGDHHDDDIYSSSSEDEAEVDAEAGGVQAKAVVGSGVEKTVKAKTKLYAVAKLVGSATGKQTESNQPTRHSVAEVYDCVPELLELVYIQNRKFKGELWELVSGLQV
jgi:hypothetical protein